MNTKIIEINDLKSDEELLITKKKKYKRPPFIAIGAYHMDAAEILADMNVPEAFVYKALAKRRDYITNIAYFSPVELNKSEQVKFNRGFKSLVEKQVVKRIKRGRPSVYMFNPDFILPRDYVEAVEKWNDLK